MVMTSCSRAAWVGGYIDDGRVQQEVLLFGGGGVTCYSCAWLGRTRSERSEIFVVCTIVLVDFQIMRFPLLHRFLGLRH